eukprot:376859_1
MRRTKKIAESSNFKKSTSKSTGETRKNTTKATSRSKKSTHPASKPNAHSYSGHTDSSSSGNVKSTTKQNNVLEGVYKDMSKSASSFLIMWLGKEAVVPKRRWTHWKFNLKRRER